MNGPEVDSSMRRSREFPRNAYQKDPIYDSLQKTLQDDGLTPEERVSTNRDIWKRAFELSSSHNPEAEILEAWRRLMEG